MIEAPIPEYDELRVRNLRQYHILDSPPEDVFDDLTNLAASICSAPIALITLIDQSRQWFKSHIGLDVCETERSVSFCGHAILQPDLFIVPDTLNDKRFIDNPFVTGSPNIRFYAGAPLVTKEGYTLGTLCVVDREPRKLTEQQLTSLKVLRTHALKLIELHAKTHELVEINRDLETFNYTLSHDLRAPIRTISGFSQIMLENKTTQLDEENKDMLTRIQNAAMRMHKQTDGLLHLSRISRLSPKFESVNLSKLATEINSEIQNVAQNRQVEMNIQPNMTLVCDPNQFRIVLENLIDNAWKYTEKCLQAKIEFGQKLLDGRVTYYVRDNGAGFNMEYAKKLFQPFQRMHSDSDFSGTGIGLAIVNRIIQNHSGMIWADAAVGEGATFYFTL